MKALDCSETEIAVQKREEAPRLLTALIAAAQRAIENSRPVIATVDEILAKHGNLRHMPRSRFLDTREVIRAITESQAACERVRPELAELKAMAWEAIAESRHLMAEIDAVIARR
jgi:hemoglobin-like flavoprotein